MVPLLVIPVIITGAVGLGASVKAGIDQHTAKETNNHAEYMVNNAIAKFERYQDNCTKSVDDLGLIKVEILNGSIKDFIKEFEKINNIELSESSGLYELQNMVLDKKQFSDFKSLQNMGSSIAGGLASGVMGGALTAFGVYSAVGMFGTASTGTAIATLSGAAASNATFCVLGGGTLAAGGLGVAGGTAVFGGLAIGPALAIAGIILDAKASANKDKAYANLAQAQKFVKKLDLRCTGLSGIRKRSNMFYRFLISLNSVFEPLVYDMKGIIKKKGTDYNNFSTADKEVIAEAMALAGAIKSILDVPILNEKGKLTEESGNIIEYTRNKIEQIKPIPQIEEIPSSKKNIKENKQVTESSIDDEEENDTEEENNNDVIQERNIYLQFSGKSYSKDDLIAMAQDVWVYDLHYDIEEIESMNLYANPEKGKVFYYLL